MLKVEKVWRFFGDFPALRDVSFEAASGECIALFGPNGAGKTTLLKLLARLARPQKGSLSLPDSRVTGYMGHGLGLYDDLSALENLQFWAKLYEVDSSRAAAWLERVQLAEVATAPVRQFSRGMRQRVALGRAFLHGPQLLVLDEPFTGLDQASVELLQVLLSESLQRGATIVLSSHQIPEAMSHATRTLRLERGRII